MPGMSPRIKAKKGRFGADGLVHTVQILSPASGLVVSLSGSPAEIPFAATGKATDAELGDLSANIVWASNLEGSPVGVVGANGASTSITLTQIGVHTISATVTQGADVVTDTITVEVTA
jgi:hypothetical protein